MDENKKTPVKTEEKDIPSVATMKENVPLVNFCNQAQHKKSSRSVQS
jgi:hypothetical protein